MSESIQPPELADSGDNFDAAVKQHIEALTASGAKIATAKMLAENAERNQRAELRADAEKAAAAAAAAEAAKAAAKKGGK